MSSNIQAELGRLAIILLLACLAQPASRAQSGRKPQGKQPSEKPIVRLETREVVIPLRAYDADGRFVDDLTTRDLIVLEEGESRPVSSVKREPANIVVVLDLSNEIGTFKNGPTQRYEKDDRPIWEKNRDYSIVARPTTRELAENFISKISSGDHVAVIQYSDKVQMVQDWTSDYRRAIGSISSKYRVGIKAGFYDAMKLAAEKLQSRPSGRRVIVLVSDGLDSASRTGRSQAMSAIQNSRASVFVVGWAEALKREIELSMSWMSSHEARTSTSIERLIELRRYLPQLDAAASILRDLAESTGGEIWLPPDHTAMIKSWQPLVAEIGAQYSVSFVTENKPSLEDNRSIQVLPARKGLTVRSRRNYFAGDQAGRRE
ncbi:MAG: VWA domain-containing protein [Acidobacteria bacterium]|nr:VWA domain-containing protein [Acidobacteriota bacterium]